MDGVGASACGDVALGLVDSSASLAVSASTSTSDADEVDVGEMGEMDRRSELEDDVSTINIGGCDAEEDFRFSGGSSGDTSIGDSERRSRCGSE